MHTLTIFFILFIYNNMMLNLTKLLSVSLNSDEEMVDYENSSGYSN